MRFVPVRTVEQQIMQAEHCIRARIAPETREDNRIKRLLEIEGIEPVVASALVAAVGNACQFGKGKDMSAWLGFTPSQHFSGGKFG
ncbi:hypothetical protein C7H79_14635 [Nitrosomonas supralitoralis]|uniref:Transposase IS116/IS110/IS902 C-terminal domain-containing protein n=1 Tax=Nitrosomonas supralitoralis TaxID=2116706 RepID=A0A2P7NS12_9PROT|nr:hypothetical protein C7H79_14635 [Nitrosomonas supralitoralis]